MIVIQKCLVLFFFCVCVFCREYAHTHLATYECFDVKWNMRSKYEKTMSVLAIKWTMDVCCDLMILWKVLLFFSRERNTSWHTSGVICSENDTKSVYFSLLLFDYTHQLRYIYLPDKLLFTDQSVTQKHKHTTWFIYQISIIYHA